MTTESSNYEGNVLTIKTVQIAPFRTLMTALKDILLETNISFQKDGIRIINMDKSHTILAHLFLRAENFELYECKMDKIIIGVNMFHLFKLINSIDNDDTLTIYIENDDYLDGITSHLGLKFENGDIKQCKTQKLRLIEPEPEELPDVYTPRSIRSPSQSPPRTRPSSPVQPSEIEIKTPEESARALFMMLSQKDKSHKHKARMTFRKYPSKVKNHSRRVYD